MARSIRQHLSHDLRNPLNVAQGRLELATRTPTATISRPSTGRTIGWRP
ncbi:histidine kinase dimerization/phospho-acceptor domain-containing protein [Natrinema gelatinilyticum]